MGVGPIPWTAINEYATARGIADRERFEYLIREMDGTWLDMHYADRDEGESGG